MPNLRHTSIYCIEYQYLKISRKYLKTEIERHRPAIGSCLGAFSSTFPVAFLEPHLNKHNQFSLLNRIADHSLEAQGKDHSVMRKILNGTYFDFLQI